MECPKCGEDNLLGARKCMSCGADMFGDLAPPPQIPSAPPAEEEPLDLAEAFPGMVAPKRPPPPPIPTDGSAPSGPSGMETVICATCTEKFERFAGDSAATCMKCRAAALSSPAVQKTGAGSDDAGVVQFGQSLGTSAFRPPPIKKKKNFNFGPILVLLVLGAGGWFGWQHFKPEQDRTRDLVTGLTAEAAAFTTAPKDDVKLETTISVHVVREEKRADFATRETVVDARVEITLLTDTEFVRQDDRGAVVDVLARCNTPQQAGTIPDGTQINPWHGHAGSERMALSARGAPSILGGSGAVVGQQVSPMFCLGMVEAPAGQVSPGTTWKGTLTLPLFADEKGRLVAADFPCNFEYVGTGDRGGYRCVGIHVKGLAPSGPPPGTGDLSTCRGRIRAALFFAADTGLLVEADLDADVHADSGEATAMHVKGTVKAARR